MSKEKKTLYVDMSDVEDCTGFTNVYYFVHVADYLGNQCGYTHMIIKRDKRIKKHIDTISKFCYTKLSIEASDDLDDTSTGSMENFSTVNRVRRLRKSGKDVVFKLQFIAGFRKYGMIAFGGYPNDYIQGMKLKNNNSFKLRILESYPLIKRTIVINIRRGDKLQRKWRTCWDGLSRGFLIVNASSVKKIIEENKHSPILFVSDDLKWCKKHFRKYKNVRFFDDVYDGNKIVLDLTVMSMCREIYGDYHCTFSQLAVILNQNDQPKGVLHSHKFFVRRGETSGFYQYNKRRTNSRYIDFRTRYDILSCSACECDEAFNYWFYINHTLNFLKNLFTLWLLKKK